MKQKIQLIVVVVIIFLFAGFIFQLGERVIHQDSAKRFSSFYFKNPDYQIKNKNGLKESLDLVIANNELQKEKYLVKYVIDGFEIETVEVDILGGKQETLPTPQKVYNYLSIKTGGQIEATISFSWSNQNESLAKTIIFPNE